ncbi:alpha/beta-hydrolase [Anaeromyces robustus]|uniref:Alpha/beta-hydrolase n=1 Tax=Anaeromyces robustus TaxID=1754192 RepID=A0A1Y1X114_9FUNG|nr:alpha/beta-hydrolase [Anaeromyces robustus]|eukprot:ORX79501.1 alpha/beta-hydrolase [Anaeromyces robustus]
MKLQQYFKGLLLLFLCFALVFSNPTILDKNENEVYVNITLAKPLEKRADIGIYTSSVGNYLISKYVTRNIYYDGLKNLDIYNDKSNNKKNKPVIIYICGGTWVFGEKSFYSLLGDYLSKIGYVTVIPNYAQFPFGNVNDMIHDISSAINWTYNNIEKYNGDNRNMILLGHSSGAHLSALTLIRNSLDISGDKEFSGIRELPQFQKTILLGGPYDFDLFSDIAKKTGEVPENSNFEIFAQTILGSKYSCPTDILKSFGDKSIQNLSTNSFILVHSTLDNVVPLSSASGLADQIRRTSNIPVNIYYADGFQHCGITEGVMSGDINARNTLKSIIES